MELVEATQLEIPGMDGYRADRLSLQFGGGVELDWRIQDDLEFVNGLKLGQSVSLTVECVVVKKGYTHTPGNGEKADATGYGVGVKVVSISE